MVEAKVKPGNKRGTWIVTESFTYKGIRVPLNMPTDGASIPWLLTLLIPKGGPLFTPAVIHDAGYRIGQLTRKEVDDVFLEAMEEHDVPLRKVLYYAVRLFGSLFYNKKEVK